MDMNLGLTREIIEECKKQKLNLWETAYVLATAYWESGKTMMPVEEGFYLKNPKKFQMKLRYFPFFGRGLVQLTWEFNYKKATEYFRKTLGIMVDFVKNPELVMNAVYSVIILVTGMRKGWFTGVELDDFIDAIDEDDVEDRAEFEKARKGVNGIDRKREIATIALDYERELKLMDYGVERYEEPIAPPPEKKNFLLEFFTYIWKQILKGFGNG